MASDQLSSHTIADCDRLLRADPAFSPSRCTPDRWTCPGCGREWDHICDEAEGCFYAAVERFDAPGCQMCGAAPGDPCDCHDPQGDE